VSRQSRVLVLLHQHRRRACESVCVCVCCLWRAFTACTLCWLSKSACVPPPAPPSLARRFYLPRLLSRGREWVARSVLWSTVLSRSWQAVRHFSPPRAKNQKTRRSRNRDVRHACTCTHCEIQVARAMQVKRSGMAGSKAKKTPEPRLILSISELGPE
jgi:hypothetical protein